jgi:hypothetical protein
MLKQIRQNITQQLWRHYCNTNYPIRIITKSLKLKGLKTLALDHFTIYDLPGKHHGLNELYQLFTAIGFIPQGRHYSYANQTTTIWLTEIDSRNHAATEVLPQVLINEFNLEQSPYTIKAIINKYSQQATPSPIADIQTLIGKAYLDDVNAANQIQTLALKYLNERNWPLPTVKEFCTVREYNEKLALTLACGRQVNHFALSIHLSPCFSSLYDFNQFIVNELNLSLAAQSYGNIKGNKALYFMQSATEGIKQRIKLADGFAEISQSAVEFVWRFPKHSSCQHPTLWKDYFTGFISDEPNKQYDPLLLQKAQQL